ncbi:hypothetical protein CONPUDRAFT_105813 [Coniophora puteana RWD-64-598 SS2]|uniref:N-acetyl-D-glucosamine kinase n=1 Tax=Coniophora puteana (strain RWD-64-598) TaxID=741705 RepID=A0A5M3MNI6_CONPW|nr:uncharacterized protein CONPUDRAFT_105813 [Coniophora puteana RWD-64-598 SS2]EIW80728.1 hypothetical protein CONPUDRAFT_105813 [Coniophora puteana RWD-64-598 SS2]
MSLYLCVDCGGSKTSAVITNASGTIVGRALGGPSNFAYVSPSAFADAVRIAVSNALKTCVSPPSIAPVALPPPPSAPLFAAAWFGISGVDSPAAVLNARTVLAELLGLPLDERISVGNDTVLLAAPLRLHPDIRHAITAIGGTGSCVVSFRLDDNDSLLKEMARTGGIGWILGDEGGGFHVGRETVKQMMYEFDRETLGGTPYPPSTLKQKVLDYFGVKGGHAATPEILTAVHIPEPAAAGDVHPGTDPLLLIPREKRLSQISPLAFDAAFKDGDGFALRVLRYSAGTLADQIAMLSRPEGEDPAVAPRAIVAKDTVICFGGTLVGIKDYRDLVIDELKKRGHVFRYIEFVDDAAGVGAVTLAQLWESKK